jgi:hypothetical protein
MPARTTPQPERDNLHTPRRRTLREQAILTIKVLLIAGGTLGVLTLLDQMVLHFLKFF